MIPPGVDFREDGRTVAPKADQPTLVTVARLTDRYKGHDRVLEAMPKILSSVPEARWVVIGDGPLRPSLEQKTAAMGLDAPRPLRRGAARPGARCLAGASACLRHAQPVS